MLAPRHPPATRIARPARIETRAGEGECGAFVEGVGRQIERRHAPLVGAELRDADERDVPSLAARRARTAGARLGHGVDIGVPVRGCGSESAPQG